MENVHCQYICSLHSLRSQITALPQQLRAVRLLLRDALVGEVSVVAILLVDRFHELERVYHTGRHQIKDQLHCFLQHSIRVYARAVSIWLDI